MNNILRDEQGKFKKGNIGFWFGKHRNKSTRDKISKNLIGICLGEKHPMWKGGKYIAKENGYINIYSPNHPRVKNKSRKYVFEHTLIMEKHIGRYLTPKEQVHHINRIPDDNRIENLLLLSSSEHSRLHQEIINKKNYHFDTTKIKKLYLDKKLSLNKLSKMFNYSVWCIRRRLIDDGIKIRSRNECYM